MYVLISSLVIVLHFAYNFFLGTLLNGSDFVAISNYELASVMVEERAAVVDLRAFPSSAEILLSTSMMRAFIYFK